MTLFKMLALALSVGLWTASAHAEAGDWDQQAAGQAAAELEAAVDALYAHIRVDNLEESATTSTNNIYLVKEDLKSLRRYTRRLSRQLNEGKDREATQRLFERLMLLLNRTRDSAVRTPLVERSLPQIEATRSALEPLAAMYGQELRPPVAPVAAPPAK